MGRRKRILTCLISIILCLSAYCAAWADTEGGAEAKEKGQTEIMAGVVVDYMGKLKFIVLDRDTHDPIPGASIEIYIPSLDQYVLFGVTDDNGIYELEVAYDVSPETASEDQFDTIDGNTVFQGELLYLSNKNIEYRVYNASWLPYPYTGSEIWESKEEQTVTIYLYKSDEVVKPVDPTKPVTPEGPGTNITDNPKGFIDTIIDIINGEVPLGEFINSGTIPKTGVDGAVPYWIAGLIAFLLAGGILWRLVKKDRIITGK